MNITLQIWLDKSQLLPMKQRLKETIRNKLIPINQLSHSEKKSLIKQARVLIYSMGSYLF